MMNRLHNCKNPWQGEAKKVLCVCSAGLLRSPTTAVILAQKFGFNTRAAGVYDYALIPVDLVLLTWADEIVCMEQRHSNAIQTLLNEHKLTTPVKCLNIKDNYSYMQEELVELINEKYPQV